jgi:SAM-dependent methyltransferase
MARSGVLESMNWLGGDVEAWNRFWRAGQRACCYQDQAGRYLPEIRIHWHEFFDRLPATSRILDVGTGNGAVPREALAWSQESLLCRLSVDGVDYADFTPDIQDSAACQIRFHPRVDCRELPFRENTFDAVTAQFAFEYLPLSEGASELARVTRPGGQLRAITHIRGGVSQHLAELEIAEIDRLVESGVFDSARVVISDPDESAISRLRKKADGLMGELSPTATLTPMVLNNVDRLYGQRQIHGAKAVLGALEVLATELNAHRRRLEMLCLGAVDGPRQENISATLQQAGFAPPRFEPIRVASNNALLALRIDTRRNPL